MFNLFKKKESVLYAPVSGKRINLESVPDGVFSSKMMGDGVAFQFDGDTVHSPCDGKVMMVAATKHAIGLSCFNGAEILIHIGLDTVNLNGQGFKVLVNAGDKVSVGKPLVQIDRKVMEENNIDLTMPMVVTNGTEFSLKINNSINDVEMGKTKMVEFD